MHIKDNTLLLGRVGSHAYGLNHEYSDEDFVGVYAVHTQQLLGLDLPDLEKAVEYKSPDTKYYEVLHFCRLALKSNPSIVEFLWLDVYDKYTLAGDALRSIRDAFPCQRYVRSAYLGYANDQYAKLLKDERVEKRAKNARHFIRLLRQGSQFYRTGRLQVRLPDPQQVRDLGLRIALGDLDVARKEMFKAEFVFDQPSLLPAEPNRELVNDWLIGLTTGLYQDRD
jgi:predicted nucleotidyltransferase